MASYNTQGITSSFRPKARPKAKPTGLASKTSASSASANQAAAKSMLSVGVSSVGGIKYDPTANDDDNVATSFISAGAILPAPALPVASRVRETNSAFLYDRDTFKPYVPDNSADIQAYLGNSAVEDALLEALGEAPRQEIYVGQMSDEEPEPNIDMSVLQGALQPDPITVTELDVKQGDTLSAIAKENGLSILDILNANPSISDPDMILTGEKIKIPSVISDLGTLFMDATDPQAPAPVSEDPDRQFYQSGVDIEDRVFDGTDPRNLGGSEGYGSVGTPPAAGLMSKPAYIFNPIEESIKEKTGEFYLNIGKKAEGDHGSTPVPTKDAKETKRLIDGRPNPDYVANEADRSKDIGFGHKVKDSENASNKIHGIPFKNNDGTYITLTDAQKVSILNADMKAEIALARSSGWDKKLKALGISWEDLDYKYQNALTSLAYNTGGVKAGRQWTAVLAAAKNEDVDSFATEMRRTDAGNNTAGMDNRVIKELYYAGIVDNRSQVSSALPLATASSGIAK